MLKATHPSPPTDNEEVRRHVIDFLNNTFKTQNHLASSVVQRILDEKKASQREFDAKLVSTKEATSQTLSSSLQRAKSTLATLTALHTSQLGVGKDLMAFCHSFGSGMDKGFAGDNYDSVGSLARELLQAQSKMDRLRKAREYLKVLVVVDELSVQAKLHVTTSPQAALVPYTHLVRLTRLVRSQSGPNENPQLIDYLEKSQGELWGELKSRLTDKFQQTLDALEWPTPIKAPYTPQVKEKFVPFRRAFDDLLVLQQPAEIEGPDGQLDAGTDVSNGEWPPLLPIEVMLAPLNLRFKFHFEGKKPTNRLDKPEWYMNHTLTTLKDHIPFLVSVLQPILSTHPLPALRARSAKDEFLRGLLVNIERKLRGSIPHLLDAPGLLSHTVHETLLFETAVREYGYCPPGKAEWDLGVVDVIIGKKEWFASWLGVEKEFAQTRYTEIVQQKDAWEMQTDDDGSTFRGAQATGTNMDSEDAPRPTKSAARLVDLLESITERYQPLPLFDHRIRFLLDIQVDLLESYANRIQSALDSFEALSLVRSVPVPGALPDAVVGVMSPADRGGTVEGLRRLCRWWASAQFVARMMKEWGEDVFFLEMWHEANRRTALEDKSNDSRRDTEPSRPPPSLSAQPTIASKEDEGELATLEDGTIFDDTVELFEMLSERIRKLIIKMILREWVAGARPYGKKRDWPLQTHPATSTTSSELSPELYAPLTDLTNAFTFLSNNVTRSSFLSVYRDLAKELDEWIWRNVLTRSQFSVAGATQLEVDMTKGIWAVEKRWIGKPENYMKRTKEALVLLTLPNTPSSASSSDNIKTCENLLSIITSPDEEAAATRLLAVLEELGVYNLSEREVKDLLGRRLDEQKDGGDRYIIMRL